MVIQICSILKFEGVRFRADRTASQGYSWQISQQEVSGPCEMNDVQRTWNGGAR